MAVRRDQWRGRGRERGREGTLVTTRSQPASQPAQATFNTDPKTQTNAPPSSPSRLTLKAITKRLKTDKDDFLFVAKDTVGV